MADGPIRCLLFGQSFFPGNQELVALSLNCLYIMEGLSLFTVLKVARNEIARGERSLVDICADLPITAHCIQLGNLRKAFDFQLLGIEKPSLFDQHVAASQEQSSLRNLASISSHIYCSTSMSFATFLLFDSESLNRNVLSDTIHRFSSKIAAAVPSIGFRSFFGIGQSKKDRPRKAEVADAHRIRINVQSRLVDPGRHADRSFVSPGSWNLMAICDEKARVLLIDVGFTTQTFKDSTLLDQNSISFTNMERLPRRPVCIHRIHREHGPEATKESVVPGHLRSEKGYS